MSEKLQQRAISEIKDFLKEKRLEKYQVNFVFHVYAMNGEDQWVDSPSDASKTFYKLKSQHPDDEIHVALNFSRRDQMDGDYEVVIHHSRP